MDVFKGQNRQSTSIHKNIACYAIRKFWFFMFLLKQTNREKILLVKIAKSRELIEILIPSLQI